eukprot:Gb_04624 [translate_table: standard]
MVKTDNSLCSETKLDATLGEFSNQFLKQLVSVKEQGNQALHDFIVGMTRKVEVQYVKEFLTPVLAKHTQTLSRVESRIKEPIINTSRIDSDYDKPIPQGTSKGNHFHLGDARPRPLEDEASGMWSTPKDLDRESLMYSSGYHPVWSS